MSKEKARRLIVIQLEMFYDADDGSFVASDIHEALERLREQAGARVIGSYETVETPEFLAKGVDTITIHSPVVIEVD